MLRSDERTMRDVMRSGRLGDVTALDDDVTSLDIRDSGTWPEFLTADEVAHVLRLNKTTVLNAIKMGTLPECGWTTHKRVSKRDLLVTCAERAVLQAAIEAQASREAEES